MLEKEIKACVSGSFLKFKPEIDHAIEELGDYGVVVLAPDKGWICIPPQKIIMKDNYRFRPLPGEKGLSIRSIEDNFFDSLSKSDFLYVINPGGCIGNSVSMEIGFAIALGIPVFLQQEISQLSDSDELWEEVKSKLRICPIKEAVEMIKESNNS